MKEIQSESITDISMDIITKHNFKMLISIIILALFSILMITSMANLLLEETILLVTVSGVGPLTLLIFLGQIFFQKMFE